MKLNWDSITYLFQIPLNWFRDADRKLNIFGDGQIVKVDRNNPEGTYIAIDTEAVENAILNSLNATEATFSTLETPSTNDSTVSSGHTGNALLNTTWTRGATGVKVYLPTDSWGDNVSRSTAWRLCEFDRYGKLQKIYAQTIRTEAVNMNQLN